MNLIKFIGGGLFSTPEIKKGGSGTGLTSFSPIRLPKGGQRCEGEVTHL